MHILLEFVFFYISYLSLYEFLSLCQIFGQQKIHQLVEILVDVLIDIRGVDPNCLGSYIKEKLKKKVL